MDTTALTERAGEIAAALAAEENQPWHVDGPDPEGRASYWPALVVGPTPRSPEPLRIIVRTGHDVGTGRVEFLTSLPHLPRVDVRDYPKPPRITVKEDRAASAIARDIARRLLPDAAGAAEDAARINREKQTAASDRDRVAAELVDLLGPGSVARWDNFTHEPTPPLGATVTVYPPTLRGPSSGLLFDVYPGGTMRVDRAHLRPPTAADAAALAALVASWGE